MGVFLTTIFVFPQTCHWPPLFNNARLFNYLTVWKSLTSLLGERKFCFFLLFALLQDLLLQKKKDKPTLIVTNYFQRDPKHQIYDIYYRKNLVGFKRNHAVKNGAIMGNVVVFVAETSLYIFLKQAKWVCRGGGLDGQKMLV
jgi:hypothetical protein